jgi:hypothetical protein
LSIVPALFLQFGGTVVLLQAMEEAAARAAMRQASRWGWSSSEGYLWFGSRRSRFRAPARLAKERQWIFLAQATVACALSFGLLGRWISSLPFLPGVLLGIGGIVTASRVTEVATEWACERRVRRELRIS